MAREKKSVKKLYTDITEVHEKMLNELRKKKNLITISETVRMCILETYSKYNG